MDQQIENIYLLSPSQKRVWEATKELSGLHRQCKVTLHGDLDIDHLASCFKSLSDRYDILRIQIVESTEFKYPGTQLVEEPIFTVTKSLENDNNEAKPDNLQSLKLELSYTEEGKHVLAISAPSILMDTASLVSLVNEAFFYYHNGGFAVQESPIQYLQFAEWQNRMAKEPDEEALDFWHKMNLSEASKQVLSFEKVLLENGHSTYEFEELTLEPIFRDYLEDRDINLATYLFGVYAICLSSHLKNAQCVISYTTDERSYDDLLNAKGLISKPLPVQVDFSKELTWLPFMQEVDQQIEESIGWEEYLETAILEQSETEIKGFDLGFEYVSVDNNNGSYRIHDIVSYDNLFKVKLLISDYDDHLSIRLCYDKSRIDASDAKILADRFSFITKNLVQFEGAVQAFNNLSPAEQNLLDELNHTQYNFSTNDYKSIIDLFDQQVLRTPENVAVNYKDTRLTYQQLKEMSIAMALDIESRYGDMDGRIVAINLDKSENLIVSIMAALRMGAIYLVIDRNSPKSRLLSLIENSNCRILITQSHMDAVQCDQYTIDSMAVVEGMSLTEPVKSIDNPAYIIFTSGSTGKPKGVAVSHKSLINYSYWFVKEAGLTADDSSLILSSLAYDLAYTGFWPCLLVGGQVNLYNESQIAEPSEISSILIEEKVSYVKLTPSHFKMLIDAPNADKYIKEYKLRLIVLGGESIMPDYLEKYFEYHPLIQFMNHFGPTETTVGTIFEKINYSSFKSFKSKPCIGRPISNNRVFILSEDTAERLPVGQVGEICIGGSGVAEGYINELEATHTKFVKNPQNKSERIYKTGDKGRILPNGKIEFLGRIDSQVKIRGYRVELGEIESAILTYPAISRVCVIFEEEQITAFTNPLDSLNKAKAFMKEKLPEYMLPSKWVEVDQFPLNRNGKVDVKKLKTLIPEESNEYIPPGNAIEAKLAEIWKKALGKNQVGITDNFFDLGGHSLKAAQIVQQIFKQMDISVSLRAVIENPTIAEISKVLAKAKNDKYESIPVLDKDQEYYDISNAQKRLWLIDQFKENQQAYNMCSSFNVEGEFDLVYIKKAFEKLISRHESLRTNFTAVEGSVKQFIHPDDKSKFSLEHFDLTEDDDQLESANQIAEDELNYVFDLENDSLLRANMIKLSDDKHILILTLHHIIADGWSLRILMMELSQLYYMYQNDADLDLNPMPIQYKDYTYWHNDLVINQDEAYWLKKLENPPEFVDLPYDGPTEKDSSVRDLYKMLKLEGDDFIKLKELAATSETTLSNLMLSAYSIMLNKISGQDDVVIGIGHANRNHPDLENLIGFFVNLLPIRVLFDEEDDFKSIVGKVSTSTIEAFEHSNYPFELLIEKVCPDRFSNSQPLVNVLYDYKNYHDLDINKEDWDLSPTLKVTPFQKFRNRSKFDLTLFVYQYEDSIQLYFEYDDLKFSEKTIDRMNLLLMNICNLLIEAQ